MPFALFLETLLFALDTAGFRSVHANVISISQSVMFSISHSKNAAGMLELYSSCGINGLNAHSLAMSGKFSSLSVSLAIGKAPSKNTSLK